MHWTTRFFFLKVKGKFFYVPSLIEKIEFPFFKINRPHFQDKSKFSGVGVIEASLNF